MPVLLEPNQSFPVVLDCDKDKPAESRPTFFVKSQSMRGQEKIVRILDRLTEDKEVSAIELFDDACNVLGEVLTGWKNMAGIEYSKEAIRDVLTYIEARELLRKVMYNQHMTNDEKKD